MASLNTLRTKGGWFLTGIIMLALLAFILSDLSGRRGGENPTVGRVNGEKVTYMDFINERTRQEGMIGQGGEEAAERAYQSAWSEIVSKKAIVPGFKEMGLGLSEAEQADMVSGTGGGYLSPVIEQFFRNPETGTFDPQMLAYFIQQNPAMWQTVLAQAGDERLFSKYSALVANTLAINDLEVKQAAATDNSSYSARVIFKPYSSIADSTISITAGELKKYYNDHKEKFKKEASRSVEYVVFDILPSAADLKAGETRAQELAQQFAQAADPAAFAVSNSDDKTPSAFVNEGSLTPAVATAILAGEMYGPILDGETYTMSRLAERRLLSDSVSFGAIILSDDKASLADSLMGVVSKNNFKELALAYSEDRETPMAGGETVTLDPMGMIPELRERLLETPIGQITRVTSGGYIFILDVIGRTAPVSKVRVATVKYAVRASAATHAEVTGKAREFYTTAVGSKAAFDKAASEMSLAKRTAIIANTAREGDGLANSLALVRWAYGAKQGAVMEPEELTRDYIVVAVLTGVTEKGVAPFDDVETQIRSLLVQRKKGDMLAETMTGSSLNNVAQGQNLEIVETDGLQFSAFSILEFGFEPRLVGAICSSKERGKLSKPVRGVSGVYAFEVTDIVTTDTVDEAGIRARLESMQEYLMNGGVMNALYEKSNVEDYRAKYF